MSKWKEIEKDNVMLSDDRTEIEVLYDYDNEGNLWLTIPVEYILELLEVIKITNK